jgi:hypothetical protein
MDHLRAESYQVSEYLAASRLSYIFDDRAYQEQCVGELAARGLVSIAPNGAIGLTEEGASWNRTEKS